MFNFPYIVEILAPKRVNSTVAKDKLNQFAERYYRILDAGLCLSVPDNPMGQRRFSLLEMIEGANLSINSDRIVMNLNTFHSKVELDDLLNRANEIGVRHLLVVRGDGGPQLSKLDPESVGGTKNVATSVDLLRYINAQYNGKFITGCAYNHYNPMPFEIDRLGHKIDAGAKFVITQPVIGKDPNIDAALDLGVPVVIEAWMSRNVELLFKSVRKKDADTVEYDPRENLRFIHNTYPDSCIYLSMLPYKTQWRKILPRLQ